MKFLQLLPGQKLILTRIETKQPPTRPVVARSTRRPKPNRTPILLALIVWTVQLSAAIRTTTRNTRPAIRANVTAFMLLASVLITVILETIAANYVSQMVGV